jgi:prepilin signal peptidase PulO-like enzyme (type II secretory pathway)
MSTWLIPLTAIVCCGAAAACDWRTGRIPYAVSIAAAALGLLLHGIRGGLGGTLGSVFGAVACAIAPLILLKASGGKGIGTTDIQLLAALGALLGVTQGLEVQALSFLLIGSFALLRQTRARRFRHTLLGATRITLGIVSPRFRNSAASHEMTSLVMGPAILLATLLNVTFPFAARYLPWLS